MSTSKDSLILGEFPRTLDERFRISIPSELTGPWFSYKTVEAGASGGTQAEERAADESERLECVLAKERPGCLSLWHAPAWQAQLESSLEVVRSKLAAGRLGDRLAQVQTLGRLLSARHRPIQLAGRGRLVVPDGFREFLAAEPGSELMIVGAAVCIEIWQRDAWLRCLQEEIPRFTQILDDLSG